MSLDYVNKGESVKATTINSIIDAIGGNQSMSPDLNVTTTARGPKVSMPYKFGGPNNPLRHYLDTGKYVLSDATFTRIVLGPTFDDCLGVFRYHTVEGDVVNPISAAVVFKNSDECPTGGELSGYLLEEDDFGKDAEAHSLGYVETMIEDDNGKTPTRAELWSWNLPDGMAAVFTNVPDELSVKSQLSSILEDNGMSGSELSSLERVGSWKLTSATSLSAEGVSGETWFDTHELVNTHDVIDVWASEAFETTHINTASIVCYDVETHEENGQTVIDSAKFAWKYWLGPDSTYEEGENTNFVHSHSWTINGQPAVFQVDDEIETLGAYNGSDVAMRDERGGYSILHGSFETESGEEPEIDAESLFVNFNYYDSYAAMIGELGSSNNSTTSDMSKSCFLAKQKSPWTIPAVEEISAGDEVPRRLLVYGTYSAVDKDWPLTDEMCPENSNDETKEKKSIEWKDNVPQQGHTEPVENTGVKSLQLYRFSEVVKSECDHLSDLQLSDKVVFVARREDESGNAWIDYINMDDLSDTVDSKIEDLYLSSIQELTYTDDDGNEIPYHQLYGFDGANIELDLNNLDKFDLVVRDSLTPGNGAQISYIPISSVLSATDVFTDTQKSQMSSIQYDDDGDGPYLELYQFNADNRVVLAPDEYGPYDLVLRDNENGFVDYTPLSDLLDNLSGYVDSELPALQLSSIWSGIWTDPNDGKDKKYHEFFNFTEDPIHVEWDLQEDYDIVLRDKNTVTGGSIVNYMPLSDLLWRPDSEGNSGQKSTSFLSATSELQLWNFDKNGQGAVTTVIPNWWEDPVSAMGSGYEFVLRAGGAGGEVEYKSLLLKQAQLSVDRGTYHTQKSLQYANIEGKTFLELNGFHADGSTLPKVTITSADTRLLPNNAEFLYRTKDNAGYWQLNYAPLSVNLSVDAMASLSVDTDVVGTQRSIEWVEDQQDGNYIQLYNMDQAGQEHTTTIRQSGIGYHLLPDDYEFVVRSQQGGQIDYMDVSLCCLLSGAGGPPISGDTQVTQNLSSLELVQPNNANPYYQLHDFPTAVKNGPNTTIKFSDDPNNGVDFSIGCNTQFVVRKPMPGGGYEIQYTTLSATQQHEPVDSGQGPSINGNAGWSLDYASYPGCNGCYQALELLNFNSGCTEHITSATISAQAGNGILIRKWNDGGCAWNLEYMDFDSLDELAKKYIGDSQLSQPPHNPYNYGLSVFWDDYDKKYAIELYNWTTDFSTKGVTIHNDGCTYYWPQNAKVDGYSGDLDYILVKHVDTNGNAELKYKQLEVTMPNIDVSQIEGDIQNIYGDINEFYDEISYLSGCIDELSGQLSGDYWESGGNTDTCYGVAIGNSNGDPVIDLDGHTFYDPTNSQYGWWFSCRFGGNDFQVEGTSKLNDIVVGHLGGDISFQNGCTYISESGSYFNGSVGVGCDLQVGNSIRIGCTSLTESQLTALLQLI